MAKKKIKKEKQHFFNNQFDFVLFITVLLLLALGIIMVLSSSSPSSLAETGSSYSYVKKQGVSVILGIVVMFFVSKIDYRFYKKFYKLAYVFSIILLVSVFVIGFSSGGARRWIDLGFTTFQPSELVKILLIVFYAAVLTDKKDKIEEFKLGFIYPLLYLVPILGLLLLQPHMSAAMIIIFITVAMMIVARNKNEIFFNMWSSCWNSRNNRAYNIRTI